MPVRVLIVDDERVNLILTSKMVERLEHVAETADNAEAALNALRTHRFDLVLMDLQMPDIDGKELTQQIRASTALGDNCTVPIFALTAYSQGDEEQTCLDAGMNGLLLKPLEMDDLAHLLDQF